MLTGENGILNKATTAKEKTGEAEAAEKVKLEVAGSFNDEGKIDIEQLNDNLRKNIERLTYNGKEITEKGTDEENRIGKLLATVEVEETKITIEENGKVSVGIKEETEGITASEIAKNAAKYYGQKVTNYECPNSEAVNAWQIFYADEENIYLIADDYVAYDYVPTGKKGTKAQKGKTEYNVYFYKEIKDDYQGSADITEEKIKKLNSDYFSQGYASTNSNMKQVAYMLDTEAWSKFKGEKAEYAIGGPTIELLFKSHNQKYNTNLLAKALSANGYQLSYNGGESYGYMITKQLEAKDSLYAISSTNNANGMWLASPSDFTGAGAIINVEYDTTVNDLMANRDSFRSLSVCLSKI